MEERRKFRAGDVVEVTLAGGLLKDRTERWVLACDEYQGQVGCLGWPEGWAEAEKVTLVEAASEEESLHQLERMACSTRTTSSLGVDRRGSVARQQWLERGTRRLQLGLVPSATFPSPAFKNQAGTIQNLVEGSFSGCALIRSPAGAARSNHWHRTDSHHLHVVSGRMLYWEEPVGLEIDYGPGVEVRTVPLQAPWLVEAGETVFTGPGVVHAIGFLAETLLVSVSHLPRNNESHEADLVRVPFVGLGELRRVAPWVEWRP